MVELSGDESLQPLDKRTLTRALIWFVIRLIAGFILIVVMMLLVPSEPGASLVLPVAVAGLGIVVYAWFFRRQVRKVYEAKYPNIQAAEALILVAAMFLALFSMVYVMTSESVPGSFTEPLDRFTAYYFSLTVLATVGFGDITPVSTFARSVTMVQMALDLAFVAVVLRVMTGAAKRALDKRRTEQANGSS